MQKKHPWFSNIILFSLSFILVLPLIGTLLNSFFRDFTSIIPKGFTFSFYTQLFTGDNQLLPVLLRTLIIALVPTILLLVLLLLAMYAIQVYFPKLDKYLDVLSKIPYGIQGVILAVSILSLYTSGGGILSNRILLLICAYSIVILPFMYQGIKNALLTIEVLPILEAAEILGANKVYAYFTIVVPSMMKGLFATMLLSTGILFGDFVLVNILAGSYYKTMGIYLNEIRGTSGHAASAVSVIMFLVMLVLSFGVNQLNKEPKLKGKKQIKAVKTKQLIEKERVGNELHRV
ncbi:putative spermidine/putrescine transport system permease protein [Carnobacterium iners]|uniref:Putative spermidine/putrescine transport system permease protein n=1 Tax=Carnobacterium iners TaxID=1073423 RepID=A0A1X7NBD0_9LACT|nr:ABC transporter permease subunit [Carnobacterium iners]SEL08012.1 putative spermidine/putrescine transport system permease protein [Carnobacterium iners]SMH34019.1 putative spermidine/putrescine transport system permease protein [Carnobacterium iners]